MSGDDLDQILSEEDDILPSSGFASSVMDAVRCEASAPPPIPFPWTRALPGLVGAGVGCVGLRLPGEAGTRSGRYAGCSGSGERSFSDLTDDDQCPSGLDDAGVACEVGFRHVLNTARFRKELTNGCGGVQGGSRNSR